MPKKKLTRDQYPTVVPQPGHKQEMVIEAWEPPKAPTPVKKLSLATIERHRQIINKMERERFITRTKAEALRQELTAQL